MIANIRCAAWWAILAGCAANGAALIAMSKLLWLAAVWVSLAAVAVELTLCWALGRAEEEMKGNNR